LVNPFDEVDGDVADAVVGEEVDGDGVAAPATAGTARTMAAQLRAPTAVWRSRTGTTIS
jgi:hypothetical protein